MNLGRAWRRLVARLTGYTLTEDFPPMEWVQVDANTWVRRHPRDAPDTVEFLEFRSTLTREHPGAHWTWR